MSAILPSSSSIFLEKKTEEKAQSQLSIPSSPSSAYAHNFRTFLVLKDLLPSIFEMIIFDNHSLNFKLAYSIRKACKLFKEIIDPLMVKGIITTLSIVKFSLKIPSDLTKRIQGFIHRARSEPFSLNLLTDALKMNKGIEDEKLILFWGAIKDTKEITTILGQHSCQIDSDSPTADQIRDWMHKHSDIFQSMTCLDLSGLELTALPEEIGLFTGLKSLSLRGNNISSLPFSFEKLTQLETLDLMDNQIKDLPSWLGNLKKLEKLFLAHNQIKTLPASMENLQELKTLDLTNNRVEDLPSWIGNLKILQELLLAGNQIKTLPASMAHLQELKTVVLLDNQIAEISPLVELVALKELDLSGNQIKELPQSIGNLKNLEVLSLSRNQIASIPFDAVSQLRKKYLKKFYFNHNLIEKIPLDSIPADLFLETREGEHFFSIYLHDNPIEDREKEEIRRFNQTYNEKMNSKDGHAKECCRCSRWVPIHFE